uniref:Uncharacterized protein n=1 Tax=Panagrolaimus sp. ES5 TaxID=591445 RepID=A0AC34FN09_9BILA
MEIDFYSSTVSDDTVTQKKKKGETGRPLSKKTQHKKHIKLKKNDKEAAISTTEADSDSTVASLITESKIINPVTVKSEKADTDSCQSSAISHTVQAMEVDVNASVTFEKTQIEVKKKGRPKKGKRQINFNKKLQSDSESKTKEKNESKNIELSFTNIDGSTVCYEKCDGNTQFIISGEFNN